MPHASHGCINGCFVRIVLSLHCHQCCQVKIKFPAQSPSKTSPKLAQFPPQIIKKLYILKVASDTPLPIKREMHFKYVTHKVFTQWWVDVSIIPCSWAPPYCSTVNYKCLFINRHGVHHNVTKFTMPINGPLRYHIYALNWLHTYMHMAHTGKQACTHAITNSIKTNPLKLSKLKCLEIDKD